MSVHMSQFTRSSFHSDVKRISWFILPFHVTLAVFCKSMECDVFPSVLWHCWLADRKGIRPVKTGCWFDCWWWWFDWSFARLFHNWSDWL